MGWIVLIILMIIGFFVLSVIVEGDGSYSGPVYGPKDFETRQNNHQTHADWVKESIAKDKARGETYDRMWADEYLDEHDC